MSNINLLDKTIDLPNLVFKLDNTSPLKVADINQYLKRLDKECEKRVTIDEIYYIHINRPNDFGAIFTFNLTLYKVFGARNLVPQCVIKTSSDSDSFNELLNYVVPTYIPIHRFNIDTNSNSVTGISSKINTTRTFTPLGPPHRSNADPHLLEPSTTMRNVTRITAEQERIDARAAESARLASLMRLPAGATPPSLSPAPKGPLSTSIGVKPTNIQYPTIGTLRERAAVASASRLSNGRRERQAGVLSGLKSAAASTAKRGGRRKKTCRVRRSKKTRRIRH